MARLHTTSLSKIENEKDIEQVKRKRIESGRTNDNLEIKSSFNASNPVRACRFPTFDVTIPATNIP